MTDVNTEPTQTNEIEPADVLKNSGVPAKVIAGLDPEIAEQWAAEIVAKQTHDSDVDTRLDAVLKRLETPQQFSEPDEEEDEDDIFDDLEPDRTVKPVAKQKPVKPVADTDPYKGMTLNPQKLMTRLQNQDATLRAVTQALEHRIIKDNVNRLKEEFPQLGDKETVAKVAKKTATLIRAGNYEDIDDAFEEACKLTLGNDGEKRKAVFKAKSTPVTVRGVGGQKQMDKAQLTDEIGRLIVEGKSDAAKALAQQHGVLAG